MADDSGWLLVAAAVAAILLFSKQGGIAAGRMADPIFAIPDNSPGIVAPIAPSNPTPGGGGGGTPRIAKL